MTFLTRALALAAVLLASSGPASAQSFLPDDARGGTESVFITILNGASEVPASGSAGLGYAFVTGDPAATLDVFGQATGLTGPIQAAHLHQAPAGSNGPVIVPLTVADANSFEDSGVTLTADQQAALAAGNVYANVHTTAFPSGEIRGQLEPGRFLVDARAAGVGTSGASLAFVGRARGAFTYINDGSAGLTVRQTSGPFFDAVQSGAITAGTVVLVRGTLSEFRQLLQINAADLTGFAIGPNLSLIDPGTLAPQPVTLEDLAAFGEQYEGQLVVLDNVTFSATGAFTAATNYTVTDGSSPSAPVVLRVPGALDSSVPGTPIPTSAARVVGIVGQFDTADPAAGYQVLLIEASDISGSTAGEAGAPSGLALAVANPIRGTAQVRFTSDAPARLALVDVLGRTVAVLADGATGAQTAQLATAGLAPGVYVLRLTAGAGVLTQTVTVVR